MSTPKTVCSMYSNQDAIRKGDVCAGQPKLTVFILLHQATVHSHILLPLHGGSPTSSPSSLTFSEVRL